MDVFMQRLYNGVYPTAARYPLKFEQYVAGKQLHILDGLFGERQKRLENRLRFRFARQIKVKQTNRLWALTCQTCGAAVKTRKNPLNLNHFACDCLFGAGMNQQDTPSRVKFVKTQWYPPDNIVRAFRALLGEDFELLEEDTPDIPVVTSGTLKFVPLIAARDLNGDLVFTHVIYLRRFKVTAEEQLEEWRANHSGRPPTFATTYITQKLQHWEISMLYGAAMKLLQIHPASKIILVSESGNRGNFITKELSIETLFKPTAKSKKVMVTKLLGLLLDEGGWDQFVDKKKGTHRSASLRRRNNTKHPDLQKRMFSNSPNQKCRKVHGHTIPARLN